MDPCAAGTFRLAAARNDIARLELISQVKNFKVDVNILGFTALHAAAAQGHAGTEIQSLSSDYRCLGTQAPPACFASLPQQLCETMMTLRCMRSIGAILLVEYCNRRLADNLKAASFVVSAA